MEVLGWIVGTLFIFAMLTALAAGAMFKRDRNPL
jgi:hypothetical protein